MVEPHLGKKNFRNRVVVSHFFSERCSSLDSAPVPLGILRIDVVDNF